MAVNDAFAKGQSGVSDTNSVTVDGSSTGTGAVNVTEIFASGDIEVYREIDTADDGSWATSARIDSSTGQTGSQANDYLCSQSQNIRIRVKNVNGNSIDIGLAGYEVDD